MQFAVHPTAKIVAELGASVKCLPGIATTLSGNKRAVLVTDKGIERLGLIDEAVGAMRSQGLSVTVYNGVEEDPSVKVVSEATEVARAEKAGLVIGFGGGSSMDVAKLAAVMAVNTQPLDSMYGIGNIAAGTSRLPLIQVPTTAGTGSEVTPITIVTTEGSEKKGVVDPLLLPDFAVLDGDLTLTMPKHVTSATGIDAMVHAIEAYTGRLKKNARSDTLAIEALRLLGANIETVCAEPDNRQARSDMLLGSCLAGMAFADSPVAAVHALAYPIGAQFHVPHGLSNALMLPHVMRANAEVPLCAKQYSELAQYCLPKAQLTGGTDAEAAQELADGMAMLAVQLGMKTQLREVGIAEGDIGALAEGAMLQQRLLVNNPREVTLELATELYSSAW